MVERYKYAVGFFDEFVEKIVYQGGYVLGGSCKEAVENIEKYYGDTIEKLYLEPECDDHVIVIKDKMEDFDVNWEGPAKNYYC